MSTKRSQQARAKLARIRADEARRRRRRLGLAVVSGIVIAAGAVVAIVLTVSGGGSPASAGGPPRLELTPLSTLGTMEPRPAAGPLGPEDVPIPDAVPLASTASSAQGQQVDG